MSIRPLKLYYNDQRGDNFTTGTDAGEQSCIASGYRFVRNEGYVYDTQMPQTSPLKLYWNAARQDNFTTSTAQGEQDALGSGYVFIRIEGYVLTSPNAGGSSPLQLYRSEQRGDNYTAGTDAGVQSAKDAGYNFVRTEGHVLTSGTDSPVPGDSRAQLNDLIKGIPLLPVKVAETAPNPALDQTQFGIDSGTPTVYQATGYTETTAIQNYTAFDPNSDVLWPGSVIRGSSIPTGLLAPINLPRTPVTITLTNLMVKDGPKPVYSVTVKTPSLPTVRAAIDPLMRQNFAATPAQFDYSSEEFHSSEQGLLKVGVDFHWVSGGVKASLDMEQSKTVNTVVFRYTQLYYSLACTPPSSPTSFFADPIDLNNAKNYIDNANPPAYVATIAYGRTLYFFVSSTASSQDIKAALNAHGSWGASGGSLDVEAKYSTLLNNSSINVLSLGGSAETNLATITSDSKSNAIKEYLTEGANYNPGSPGLPISYELRYLTNNDPARISLTAAYAIGSARPQNITSVRTEFDLTTDDKDVGEEIQLWVMDGDTVTAYGGFGQNQKWKNPGQYPCDIPVRRTCSSADLGSMSIRMYKTPRGSDTGNGMEGMVKLWYTTEDGAQRLWMDIAEHRYGDSNPFNVRFQNGNRIDMGDRTARPPKI